MINAHLEPFDFRCFLFVWIKYFYLVRSNPTSFSWGQNWFVAVGNRKGINQNNVLYCNKLSYYISFNANTLQDRQFGRFTIIYMIFIFSLVLLNGKCIIGLHKYTEISNKSIFNTAVHTIKHLVCCNRYLVKLVRVCENRCREDSIGVNLIEFLYSCFLVCEGANLLSAKHCGLSQWNDDSYQWH
jgi:hypothetical protein